MSRSSLCWSTDRKNVALPPLTMYLLAKKAQNTPPILALQLDPITERAAPEKYNSYPGSDSEKSK